MAAKLTVVNESEADKSYGYRFGVDGMTKLSRACKRLDVSRDTVERLCAAGKLRRGKVGGRIHICTRSLENYLASIET